MKKTTIGGSALIEGLMMIGPQNAAIAIRKPDSEIVIENRPLPKKDILTKIPVLRGVVMFFRQIVLTMKALMYSAEFVEIEDENDASKPPSKVDKFLERVFGDKLKDAVVYFAVITSIAFSVGLFMLLPNLLAGLINFNKETTHGVVLLNLFEGLIRILIFFAYLAFSSMLKDIKRVWQYHGAEHKTIHCYENEEELTVENIRKFSIRHPRCGTAFMFLVMVVSILVFSFTGWHSIIVNLLIRLPLVPVVAGLSYELLKFAGRHSDWTIMKAINAPGLLFQYFTTREPDDSQIEVAIAAMSNVLVEDKKADIW